MLSLQVKALNDPNWHGNYCKIEQTIGYLHGDEETLHIIAIAFDQGIDL